MTEKENYNARREPRWLLISVVTAGVILLMFALIAYVQYGAVKDYIADQKTPNDSAFGLSGDFFGLANAVFSALAFAMIIVTLWMQKHELKQQREELEITRDVLKQQQCEMKEQNESLRRQTFENTFFGMLRMHSEIVSTLTIARETETGREVFRYLIDSFASDSRLTAQKETVTAGKPFTLSVKMYAMWYQRNGGAVGHYFRTLYNLMRYVHEDGGCHRKTYARLVRAQLSSNELLLLLFNGLSKYGNEKFKPLIEEYALLKHLGESPEHATLRAEYQQSAFG